MTLIARDIEIVSKVLQDVQVPLIIWGEYAMRQYSIPTSILRDDILVADDKLDDAATALKDLGWTISTGPLPMSHGVPTPGWEPVDAASRRFFYPKSLPGKVRERELLILPTSFVGLGPNPTLDLPDFTHLADNMYCPSSHLLLITFLRTAVRYDDRLRGTLLAWVSYFYCYAGFKRSSLDDVDVEQEVLDLWHTLVDVSSTPRPPRRRRVD